MVVESDYYVPDKTRYGDRAGVEVKELTADPESIRFDGADQGASE